MSRRSSRPPTSSRGRRSGGPTHRRGSPARSDRRQPRQRRGRLGPRRHRSPRRDAVAAPAVKTIGELRGEFEKPTGTSLVSRSRLQIWTPSAARRQPSSQSYLASNSPRKRTNWRPLAGRSTPGRLNYTPAQAPHSPVRAAATLRASRSRSSVSRAPRSPWGSPSPARRSPRRSAVTPPPAARRRRSRRAPGTPRC